MHDTVKDHVVQHAQKTCKNGIDIAESLEKEEMKDLSVPVPTRKMSGQDGDAARKTEQDGFVIIYKAQMQKCLDRVQQSRKQDKGSCIDF